MHDLTLQALATLLLSLRIVPTIVFAQPFTLLRVPPLFRVMLALALSATFVAAQPSATWRSPYLDAGLPTVAATELVLGVALALPLQLAFGAIMIAGRMIDIQAGFGLAALIDPTTKAQMPLVGTLLAYTTAAIFFMGSGPADCLAVWSAAIEAVPLGMASSAIAPTVVTGFAGTATILALGLVGLVTLVLFGLDLAIALLSRTMPQMNVLILGFQVKVFALLLCLPLVLAMSATVAVNLLRAAVDATIGTFGLAR